MFKGFSVTLHGLPGTIAGHTYYTAVGRKSNQWKAIEPSNVTLGWLTVHLYFIEEKGNKSLPDPSGTSRDISNYKHS